MTLEGLYTSLSDVSVMLRSAWVTTFVPIVELLSLELGSGVVLVTAAVFGSHPAGVDGETLVVIDTTICLPGSMSPSWQVTVLTLVWRSQLPPGDDTVMPVTVRFVDSASVTTVLRAVDGPPFL